MAWWQCGRAHLIAKFSQISMVVKKEERMGPLECTQGQKISPCLNERLTLDKKGG